MNVTNLDRLSTGDELHWYRHAGWQEGSGGATGPHPVGTGWEHERFVFATSGHIIYHVTQSGDLYWQNHHGWKEGTVEWPARQLVLAGFASQYRYLSVFAAEEGVIYAITADGHLHWYKHEGWQDGKAGLTGPKVVGLNSSWNFYASVFAGGDGILYAVNPDGNLRWHRHEGWRDGEESWKVLNHDPRVTRIWAVVGEGGWDAYVSVFSAGNGLIYAVTAQGELRWYRHEGWQSGEEKWEIDASGVPWKVVEAAGWLRYRTLFAGGDGVIYGVGVGPTSWMSLIPGGRKLNQLTIPGTHDTGTWGVPDTQLGFTHNAKCQSLSLRAQLDAGIRFIDIRVVQDTKKGSKTPDFAIYHGPVNTGNWFSTDIVDVCKQFLAEHPSETIVMSVKDASGSTDRIEAHVLEYLTNERTESSVPALWHARGRIVLVRRYEDQWGSSGIPASKGWPDDDVTPPQGVPIDGGKNTLKIQDVYGYGLGDHKVAIMEILGALGAESVGRLIEVVLNWPNDLGDDSLEGLDAVRFHGPAVQGLLVPIQREKIEKKWSFVEKHLNGAMAEHDDKAWWINFSSASGPPPFLNPLEFAKGVASVSPGDEGINKRLCSYLEQHPTGYLGTVMMDFPEYPNDGELIKRLIVTNFPR